MNKGLIYRSAQKQKRHAILVIAIFFFVISHLAAYAVGRIEGFERGMEAQERIMEDGLKEGIQDSKPFRMRGINILFTQRRMPGSAIARIVEEGVPVR